MQQGGLDWELIAMVAAAASLLVIVWDFFATRAQGRSEARRGAFAVHAVASSGCLHLTCSRRVPA